MSIMFELMREAVDYAGLFPPASLGMAEVVSNYESYRHSPDRAMLGRLIVPAAKLTELESLATALPSRPTPAGPWQISALIPSIDASLQTHDFDAALNAIDRFNDRNRSASGFVAVVDALEVKVDGIDVTRVTIDRLPPGISCFLEDSSSAPSSYMIELLSQVMDDRTLFAKIRTGGVTPELIPPPEIVAQFIGDCAKHDVGFKATAGLHHPLRGEFRLTYANDAIASKMFGYLNVFVATMIAFEHFVSEEILIDILTNEDPSKFIFEDQSMRWGNWSVSPERVAKFRKRGIISFGSCSFTEPTTELVELPNISRESVFSQ